MDSVLDRPWTRDSFLAWEDQQEGKFEFNGRNIIPTTGGTVAHQMIVFNVLVQLSRLMRELPFWYYTKCGCASALASAIRTSSSAPLDQTTRTLTDAVAIFEVLSDDTAVTDRVTKLIDYAAVPSLRSYVLLEQSAVAATLFQREPGSASIASAHTIGELAPPGLDISLPLADLYEGLTFPAQISHSPED